MKNISKLSLVLTLIFLLTTLLLVSYDLFADSSKFEHSASAWFIGALVLLALIFTVQLFTAKSSTPNILTLVCIITAGMIATFATFHWMLICLIISLIGLIVHKAGRIY